MTGIICINKDSGITSFGVVKKARYITGEKKAGHTGTLDPMATGVLPIMLGGATKFLNYIPNSDKGYRAQMMLGITTDTLDITGKVLSKNTVRVTLKDIENALDGFKGEIMQMPPMFSAKSVDGKRLYEFARNGIEIERKPCRVEIKRLEITDFDEEKGICTLNILCSKGTYVRSLIDDLGKQLGCGAVMTSLCRTFAAGFSLSDCCTLSELQSAADADKTAEKYLFDVENLYRDYKKINVTDAQSKRFSNGGALDINRIRKNIENGEICAVYSDENIFLGLGKSDGNELNVLRLLIRN